MAALPHRNVYSWPADGGFHADSEVVAKDMGIDVIENDVKTEVLNMVKEAKEEMKDEPFCVFDMGSVVERYQLWKKAFPTIKPFYAVKSCDDPVVIKVLNELGAGFDCASKGEMELAEKVGVKPDNIVFSNAVKLPSHLKHAAEKGVSLMSFDSRYELTKIKECYPGARLLLRICPKSKANVDLPLFGVWGCHMDEAADLIRTAKVLDLSLVGVSFHVGSGISNPEDLLVELINAREIFDMAEQEGFQMDVLDIGGGFYGRKGTEEQLLKMGTVVNNCLKQNFPDTRVISEPGRYFVESGLTMAASIIGRRDRKRSVDSDDVQVPEFWLSASAFGLVNRSIALASAQCLTYYPALALREPAFSTTYDYLMRGPTCAPVDIIYCGGLPELQVGDWLLFRDVGAYSVPISSAFNGFPTPSIRRVMKKNMWKALACHQGSTKLDI